MKSFAIAVAAVIASLAVTSAEAGETAQYQVQFKSTWTAQSHPIDYPDNAHHSGFVGTTHSSAYRLFEDAVWQRRVWRLYPSAALIRR